MQHFQKVYLTIYAVVASLAFYVLNQLGSRENIDLYLKPIQEDLDRYLKVPLETYRSAALVVIVFALVGLFRMSNFMSEALIERVPFLSRGLRRFLSGHRDIEGDWPLVVVDMEKRRPLYFGALRIDFKNGQHFVHGDDWNIDGTHAHSFCSVQSMYHDCILQYWYEQGESLHQPSMRGYTEIFFFPKFKLAQRHAGKFLDPRHVTDIRFYAIRHRFRALGRRLRSNEKKLAAARELWSQLEPQLEALSKRGVGADFTYSPPLPAVLLSRKRSQAQGGHPEISTI